MKSPYANELTPDQEATAVFLVQGKEVRQKRTGEPYLSLILADKTGEIDAKMWDNAAAVIPLFEKDDFVKVRGAAQVFQNRLQFTIHRLSVVPAADIDLTDFLPSSARDLKEMFEELRGLILAMTSPHLRALLAAFFADEEIARAFRSAPAAKSVHHAYIGGLMEHVLSMAKVARFTAAHYPGIDADLLLAGVILHDIGKIRELSYSRSFGYTTEGQLLGHMQIALRMLSEKIRAVPGFPPKQRMLLEHMILSHHGALEFGSPKTPMFPEAMLLHLIDNLDAKMNAIECQTHRDNRVDGEWTAYVPSLERSLLKKSKFLEEPPPLPVNSSASTAMAEKLADALAAPDPTEPTN